MLYLSTIELICNNFSVFIGDLADSVVEFAVAEMPVSADQEEDYLKIYKLILSEYLPDENAEIIIANSRMIGSGMRETKNNVHSYSILLISSKNQYLFKLSSRDRREMMMFKDKVLEIAKSLVETGEIYVATEEAKKKIGLSFLLQSNDNGFLSIGKAESPRRFLSLEVRWHPQAP